MDFHTKISYNEIKKQIKIGIIERMKRKKEIQNRKW